MKRREDLYQLYTAEGPLLFTQKPNGRVVASHFPARLAVASDLLRSPLIDTAGGLIRRKWRTLWIEASNGCVEYRIVHRIDDIAYGCVRVGPVTAPRAAGVH